MNAIAEYISLADAATATGKTKSTVFRRVKNTDEAKRIIAVQNDAGEWQINTQSLMQHYRLTQDGIAYLESKYATAMQHADATPIADAIPIVAPRNTEFEHKIELLEERVANKERIIDDLKRDKERLIAQVDQFAETINKQTLLITARNDQSHAKAEDLPPNRPLRTIILIALLAGILGAGGSIWLDRQSNVKQMASDNSAKSDDKPLLSSGVETGIRNNVVHSDVQNQFLVEGLTKYAPLDVLKAVITRAD